MSELVRFSVAMPEELLVRFDNFVARRGLAINRSEVIRDLVREALIEEQWHNPDAAIIGTLTLVYDSHVSDLIGKLEQIQHACHDKIISTMHIHLDAHNCMKIIAMRGSSTEITAIADGLLGIKGVRHGSLTTTGIDAN
jgi:CopG family nickel-responsive transcriptional regulator